MVESETAAIIAAAAAALGFVGKELWVVGKAYLDQQRQRRSRLVQLHSMLRAAHTSFLTQHKHREALRKSIEKNHANVRRLGDNETIDDYFARSYSELSEEEGKRHAIIRGITMYSLRPLNAFMLKWLQDDEYFKGAQKPALQPLSDPLARLEVHLLHWLAKYEVWIKDERRALVYLDDEDKHGVGFPTDIDRLVAEVVFGKGSKAGA